MSAEAVGWVFKHSPYKGTALLVHLALADAVNDLHDNEIWATQTTVGIKSRTSRETASRIMGGMVRDGCLVLLEDNARTGKPNRYRFMFGPGGGVTNDHTPGVMNDHTGCDERSQGGVTNDHTEPKREPKEPLSPPVPGDGLANLPTVAAIRERRTTYPDAFVEAWRSYPRNKGSKIEAYGAWRASVEVSRKQGVTRERRVEGLLRAAQNYARDCEDANRSLDHIMHGATFWGPHERWKTWVKPPTEREVDYGVPSWATGQKQPTP